jgi:hypothetical protein
LALEKQTVMALPDEKMATLNDSSSPVRDVGIAHITPLVENADVAFQLLKNDQAAPVTLDKAAFARVLRKIDFLLMPVMASVSRGTFLWNGLMLIGDSFQCHGNATVSG